VDFSDLSSLALKYAAVGAFHFNADLIVMHAERIEVPPYILADDYERLLSELEKRRQRAEDFLADYVHRVLGNAAERLNILYLIVEGHPADAILQASETEKAELIVMGTHGRTGWQRFRLGSVTETVVRGTKVPVFVVRQKEREFIDVNDPTAVPKLTKILCPVNFTETAKLALNYAAAIAVRFKAHLTALYIDEEGKTDREKASDELCRWFPDEVTTQCSVEPIVLSGHAANQIIAFAQEGDFDLLVIGAERKPFLHSILFGTTTETILRASPIPILVVPAQPNNFLG
jgi:nucleotide-binding universal stress UspA family protein